MLGEEFFLRQLFDGLNLNKIRYCVLRNYTSLPVSTGKSDLDILIEKKDAIKFVSFVNDIANSCNGSIVSIIYSKTCPRICVLGSGKKSWGVMIDLHFDKIAYLGHTILTEEILWKNTFLYNNEISALNKKADVLNALLKELLNNKTCKERYFEDFKQTSTDSAFLKEVFSSNCKPELVSTFLEIQNKDYSDVQIKHLVKILDKSFPKKRFNILTKLSKFTRVFRQPGFTIAFIGTDGSGKSTIIEQIRPALSGAFHKAVYYEHMRPNKIPSIARLMGKKEKFSGSVSNPHDSKTSGFLGSLFRWFYYMLDYTFGFYLKVWPKKAIRSSVWLFDRYYYDYLIDPKRARIKLPSFILKLGQVVMPEPDIILCLGTNAKKIHKRKPELPLEEVERQVRSLQEFCARHSRAVWIDTGKSIEESSEESLIAIIAMMTKRFENMKLP